MGACGGRRTNIEIAGGRPMSEQSLASELRAVERLAFENGLRKAEHWIATERKRRYGREGWPYGACVWCEAVNNKRRKATVLDPGSGTPCCERHAPGGDESIPDDVQDRVDLPHPNASKAVPA
jgi:hypothetical protein